MGKPNKRVRAPKSQVVFDEGDRAKYLLGFHKRKVERKKRARDELEDRIKKEHKRQKELKSEAMMEERKKAGLPMFNNTNEVKLTNRDVIDTGDNTIIISDFSRSLTKSGVTGPNSDEDSEDGFDRDERENTQVMKKSEQNDAEITKTKSKIDKESSIIQEKLRKLTAQKKKLEMTNSKMKKNLLKSKNASKNSKSTKKFTIRSIKNKNKKKQSEKK